MIARRIFIVLFLSSVAIPATAWCKGQTSRVVLTCAGFARPVELRSGPALATEYGPWGNGLIDATKAAVARPEGDRVCELYTFVRYSRTEERLAYVVYYIPQNNGRAGHIYFPGRADPWYGVNTSSMLRAGIDGTWRVASSRWEESVARPAIALER